MARSKDEAHTLSFSYGGLTRAWKLRPDIVVLGKGLGSGIPFGAYGVREALQGLEEIFRRRGLPWRAPQIGGRSGWVLFPELPRNAEESHNSLDPAFVDTRRVFMANRGVWEAIASAGPACSFAHVEEDVTHYLDVAAHFVDNLLGL